MRKQISKVIRKEFDDLIKEKISKFRKVNLRKNKFLGNLKPEIPPGDMLYLWVYDEGLYFYLLLKIAPPKMGDAFTIECAWSCNAKFPALLGMLFPRGVPKSDILPDYPRNGDMRFRLGFLYDDPEDHWWWVSPQLTVEKTDEWLKKGDFEGERLFEPQKLPIEQALKNVKQCVKSSVDDIIKYALPYFGEIIDIYKNDPNFWRKYEKYNTDEYKKSFLLESKGGLGEKKCIWAKCDKKCVKGSVYCIDHLYESTTK